MIARKSKAVAVVITLLIILALIGIFANVYWNLYMNQTTLVNINGINASIYSDTDDYFHNIYVDFSLDVNKSYSRKIDRDLLRFEITNAVKALDYNKITEIDSVEYIKTEVINHLSEFVPPDKIKDLYISNIGTDIIDASSENSNTQPPGARGLFKKMQ